MQLKPINELTNNEIKELLEVSSDVIQYFEEVKKLAIEKLKNGEKIEEYTLEPIRAYKMWDRSRYDEIIEKIKEIEPDKNNYKKLFKLNPMSYNDIKKQIGDKIEQLDSFLQDRRESYKIVKVNKIAEIFNEL